MVEIEKNITEELEGIKDLDNIEAGDVIFEETEQALAMETKVEAKDINKERKVENWGQENIRAKLKEKYDKKYNDKLGGRPYSDELWLSSNDVMDEIYKNVTNGFTRMKPYAENTTLAKVYNEKLEKVRSKTKKSKEAIMGACKSWHWVPSAHGERLTKIASWIDGYENEIVNIVNDLIKQVKESMKIVEKEKKEGVDYFNIKDGVYILTKSVNPKTAKELFGDSVKKGELWDIDYSQCTNQKMKDKYGKGIQKFTKNKEGELIIKTGKGSGEKVQIWEGVRITPPSQIQKKAEEELKNQEYRESKKELTREEKDRLYGTMDPKLREKLKGGYKEEFFTRTEKILEKAIRSGKAKRWVISTEEPVSRVGWTKKESFVEIHYVDENGKKHSESYGDEKISDGLIKIIDGNEGEFVNYMTLRIREKWGKYDYLTRREEVLNQGNKGAEVKEEKKNQIIHGLNLLKPYLEAKKAEDIVMYIDDVIYSIKEKGKINEGDVAQIINGLHNKMWGKFESTINKNYGYGIENQTDKIDMLGRMEKELKAIIENIVKGDKATQEREIRELGELLGGFNGAPETGYIGEEIVSQEGVEIKEEKYDKCFQKIDELLNIELKEGETIEDYPEKKRKIDKLYQSVKGGEIGTGGIAGLLTYLTGEGILPGEALTDIKEEEKLKGNLEELGKYLKEMDERINNFSMTEEDLKKGREKTKTELESKGNLTEEEKEALLVITERINSSNPIYLSLILDSTIESTKEGMRYGGINEIVKGGVVGYLAKKGGGIKGVENDEIYNDIIGAGGIREWSDEFRSKFWGYARDIAIDVAILAISGGIAGIAAGAAISAAGKVGELLIKVPRLKKIYNIAKRTGKIGKLAFKTAGALGHVAIEGSVFQFTNVILGNIVSGRDIRNIMEGTGDIRGYAESIAFFGVLKVFGGMVGKMSESEIVKMLQKKMDKNTIRKFTKWTIGMGTEMGLVRGTGQVVNMMFGEDLEGITGESAIHLFGVVVGLRITKKVESLIINKDGSNNQYKINVKYSDGTGETIKVNEKGEIIGEKKGKQTENRSNPETKEQKNSQKEQKNNESRGKNNGEDNKNLDAVDQIETHQGRDNEVVDGTNRDKQIEMLSQELGPKFHEERRKGRLNPDGTYKPQYEKVTDPEWIAQHGGQTQVDVANTKFEDLPSERKYENLEAAKVAIELVYEKVSMGEDISPGMIEEMSKVVHDKRLERNGTKGSLEKQRVPYEKLSESEKVKDRDQVLLAIDIVKQNISLKHPVEKTDRIGVVEDELAQEGQGSVEESLFQRLKDLGVYVHSEEQIKNLKLTEAEIENIKRVVSSGVRVEVSRIDMVKNLELTEAEIENIKRITSLGIRVTPGYIEDIKGLTETEIKNIERVVNLGIDVLIMNIKYIKDITLTQIEIENIERIKTLGIQISVFEIKKIKDIGEPGIKRLKEAQKLGVDLNRSTSFMKELSEISEEGMEKLKDLKDLGVDISCFTEFLMEISEEGMRKLKELKDLGVDISIPTDLLININEEGMKRLKELKALGVDISISTEFLIEISEDGIMRLKELKDLGINISTPTVSLVNISEEGIKKLKELKDLGVDVNNLILVKELSEISEDGIMRLKELKNLGIYINDPRRIEELTKISAEGIKKLEELQDLGVDIVNISINDFRSIRKLSDISEEGVKRLKDLKEKYILNLTDYKSVSDVLKLSDEDIRGIEKLKDTLKKEINTIEEKIANLEKKIMDRKNEMEELKKGLKGVFKKNKIHKIQKEIESMEKNLKSMEYYKEKITGLLKESNILELKEFGDFASEISLDQSEIRDYIERRDAFLRQYQTLSDEKFNELFKDENSEAKYGMSEIYQTQLGYCYANTGFELLKKSNFFEVLIKTSIKETDSGWEVKLPLGDRNGIPIKVKDSELNSVYDFTEIDKNKPEDERRGDDVHATSNSSKGFKILEIAFIKQYAINNTKYKNNPIAQAARDEFVRTGDITLTADILHMIEGGWTTDFFVYTLGNNIVSTRRMPAEKGSLLLPFYKTGNIKITLSRSADEKIEKRVECSLKNGLTTRIRTYHAYSIERTYYDPALQKEIVVFVNPWYTDKKYEVTVDECKKIFNTREVAAINMKNMFK